MLYMYIRLPSLPEGKSIGNLQSHKDKQVNVFFVLQRQFNFKFAAINYISEQKSWVCQSSYELKMDRIELTDGDCTPVNILKNLTGDNGVYFIQNMCHTPTQW